MAKRKKQKQNKKIGGRRLTGWDIVMIGVLLGLVILAYRHMTGQSTPVVMPTRVPIPETHDELYQGQPAEMQAELVAPPALVLRPRIDAVELDSGLTLKGQGFGPGQIVVFGRLWADNNRTLSGGLAHGLGWNPGTITMTFPLATAHFLHYFGEGDMCLQACITAHGDDGCEHGSWGPQFVWGDDPQACTRLSASPAAPALPAVTPDPRERVTAELWNSLQLSKADLVVEDYIVTSQWVVVYWNGFFNGLAQSYERTDSLEMNWGAEAPADDIDADHFTAVAWRQWEVGLEEGMMRSADYAFTMGVDDFLVAGTQVQTADGVWQPWEEVYRAGVEGSRRHEFSLTVPSRFKIAPGEFIDVQAVRIAFLYGEVGGDARLELMEFVPAGGRG